MNYFRPEMTLVEVNKMSVLGLAHIGDAAFELMVRTMLCESGNTGVTGLHFKTVDYVSATAQARAALAIADMLSEEETAVFRRGRNAKVNSVPKNARVADYHAATGLEALFGWLWLQGKTDRLQELFHKIEEVHHAG